MTSRARILLFSLLACSVFATSSACRGQSGAAQPANAVPATAHQADVEAAVAVLCKPVDITRSKTGSITGCKNCPEGTDFRTPNSGDTWTFVGAMTGHFTSTHEEVLAVDGAGCDSHAMNWGGSYIFSMSSGKLRLIRYDQGLHTDGCHKFRHADGREFLVCRGGWTGQGENVNSVFQARFDATAKDTETTIFSTTDTTGMCDDASSRKVDETRIVDMKFASKDSGELTGMTITATYGKITCGQARAKRSPGIEPPSVKTYELHYNFDGKKFTIAPESRAALRAFPQQ